MPQIGLHPWLADCPWPREERGYRPYPRLGSDNLSDSEKAVFVELGALGVTEEVLRREMMQGVRSPAIASYRILLHRALRCGAPSRRVSREVVRSTPLPSPPKAQKSRTCTLL